MRKRILSFILTLCMVLALMPTTVRVSAADHTNHCICGASHTDVGDHGTESVQTFTAWNSNNSLPDHSGSYYLTTDVTLSTIWTPYNGTVLCLNGHTITGPSDSYLIEVNNGVTFTLTDCMQSGKIVGGAPHTISIIGTFNMYGGSITGSSYYGVLNEGSFNMYGGSVTENTGISGGGVYNNNGDFNMYGGSITENADSGVRNKGTFTMNSGEIAKNTGGGVDNGSSATFNINGGSITENKTRGVCNAGTFTMNSGEIARNIVGGNGGGVFNAEDAIFNMNGGSIIENIARPYLTQVGCAGVYNAGTFTISGNAIIKDNKKRMQLVKL